MLQAYMFIHVKLLRRGSIRNQPQEATEMQGESSSVNERSQLLDICQVRHNLRYTHLCERTHDRSPYESRPFGGSPRALIALQAAGRALIDDKLFTPAAVSSQIRHLRRERVITFPFSISTGTKTGSYQLIQNKPV
ncbi:uncharacterized protein LOC129775482 [Toxorhynchites rutilus septentrionalis]|uniref:uncharacterized protein LOC129775482 n=1 Tax=Toxorhynchites rutilus septentrionalis TaxID=329112 RepID=UPI00247B1E7D|nr:uncharacterized protein LOC129775482 [Toxorhynchites rutilus septentrionalis]